MHLTRAEITRKIPVPRKGTKYVARARSHHKEAVPVVIAIRDMLQLAQTSKEVKEMIKNKLLELNGREVKDTKESIRLFNILKADKQYELTLTTTGRFAFLEHKGNERLCKVIGKTILKGEKMQLNLHDGSNALANNKINVHDSVYLDLAGKIVRHLPLEKGKDCFVMKGKYLGHKGKIESLINRKVKIKLVEKSVELGKENLVVV